MTINDEDLLALVDGRLEEARAAELRAQLASDLRAAARLQDISRSGDILARVETPVDAGLEVLGHAIRSGDFDRRMPGLAGENGPVVPLQRGSLGSTPATKFKRRSMWQQGSISMKIAAGIALMTFGFLAGYWGGVSTTAPQQHAEVTIPTWVVRVVDYHTLYARETVAAAAVTKDQQAELKSRFEDALDTRVHIPNLSTRKLEFRRGQLLRFEDRPIIQLAYLPDVTGSPVALCLRASDGPDSAPAFSTLHGIGVVRWRQRGLAYVLVGHRTEADLLADARKAVAEIDASDTI